MATSLKQELYGTDVPVFTTGLNSLADGSGATSAALGSDATTAQPLYGDFVLVLASLTPTGSPYVDLYLLRSADGTNYEDTPTSVAGFNAFVGSFTVPTGAAAKRAILRDIPLPPGLWKAYLVNHTNVAFAASGNTLDYRPHNLQNV